MNAAKIRRTKTGCLTCRRRRKKCDERKTTCLACQRNGLTCIWASERRTSTPDALGGRPDEDQVGRPTEPEPESSMPCPSLLTITLPLSCNIQIHKDTVQLQIPNFGGILTEPLSRTFLQHYIHETAQCLTTRRDSINPFVTEILPIAQENRGLMHAVLAFSGQHLVTRANKQMSPVIWTHYSTAISEIRSGVERYIQGDRSGVTALLATTLMLCLTEVGASHCVLTYR